MPEDVHLFVRTVAEVPVTNEGLDNQNFGGEKVERANNTRAHPLPRLRKKE
ncbi:hypothetical protein KEJ47_05015 [Candidatus Bathyarchaeota archaeon]|nr:hypothetical protein [Candidatus Bathyarchaeota archaeon]